jgi:hypothetical protein
MSNITKPPTPTERIRELNDRLRTQFVGGKIMRSAGVAGMEPEKQAAILQAMREFKDFNADNDPYGEHDCFSFEVMGEQFIAKIDYYDLDERYGADDPADAAHTSRVLTVMLSHEY